MESLIEELAQIADELETICNAPDIVSAKELLRKADSQADEIERAWSGSWLGYHASVYTKDLKPPPPGQDFDPMRGFLIGVQPAWTEFSFEQIESVILNGISSKELADAKERAFDCGALLENKRKHVISIILASNQNGDVFLDEILSDIRRLSIPADETMIQALAPKGAIVTRDQKAMGQDRRVPPHKAIQVRMRLLNTRIDYLKQLHDLIRQAEAHMKRVNISRTSTQTLNDRIFIGHGRSGDWRELEKFLDKRLRLKVDEFNRVPTGGKTAKERLEEMLNSSCFAFLVLTAEDEIADDNSVDERDHIRMQARMNVIHEAGLFQGRLGFDKAIILLENGCEEFSNIHGLGQIRFDKGKIRAIFEEVRRHLERAEIISK